MASSLLVCQSEFDADSAKLILPAEDAATKHSGVGRHSRLGENRNDRVHGDVDVGEQATTVNGFSLSVIDKMHNWIPEVKR